MRIFRHLVLLTSLFFLFLSLLGCCVLDPCGCDTCACDQDKCTMSSDASHDSFVAKDTSAGCTPISTSPTILGVTATGQVCQNWCWAATITMVVGYMSNPIPLCKPPTDKQWQTRGVHGYNCCSFQACATQCNQTATVQEMQWHLSHEGMASILLNRKLTETELQLELTLNRPVIVGYLSSFFGHVVLVSGFIPGSPSKYRVIDPYYGVFEVTYDQLSSKYKNGAAYWGQTFYRFSHSYLPAPVPKVCAK